MRTLIAFELIHHENVPQRSGFLVIKNILQAERRRVDVLDSDGFFYLARYKNYLTRGEKSKCQEGPLNVIT